MDSRPSQRQSQRQSQSQSQSQSRGRGRGMSMSKLDELGLIASPNSSPLGKRCCEEADSDLLLQRNSSEDRERPEEESGPSSREHYRLPPKRAFKALREEGTRLRSMKGLMEEAGEKTEKRETIEVYEKKGMNEVNEKKEKSVSFEGYHSDNEDQINDFPIKSWGLGTKPRSLRRPRKDAKDQAISNEMNQSYDHRSKESGDEVDLQCIGIDMHVSTASFRNTLEKEKKKKKKNVEDLEEEGRFLSFSRSLKKMNHDVSKERHLLTSSRDPNKKYAKSSEEERWPETRLQILGESEKEEMKMSLLQLSLGLPDSLSEADGARENFVSRIRGNGIREYDMADNGIGENLKGIRGMGIRENGEISLNSIREIFSPTHSAPPLAISSQIEQERGSHLTVAPIETLVIESESQMPEDSKNGSRSVMPTRSNKFTMSSFSNSHSFMHNPSCSCDYTLDNQDLSSAGNKHLTVGTIRDEKISWKRYQTQRVSYGLKDSSQHGTGILLYQQQNAQNGNVQDLSVSNQSSGSNNAIVNCHFGETFGAQELKVLRQQCDDTSKKSALNMFNQKDLISWMVSNQQSQFERERGKSCLPSIGDINVVNEKIGLFEIATEPIATVVHKMQELPESVLVDLKRLAKELLGSFEKRKEFLMLQDMIRRRVDLTEQTLLHANMTQLEILVALKTGLCDYVKEDVESFFTCEALVEIFLQRRCRNIDCKQALPVGGCDCSVCSQKNGFCSECMCVVCFKFDSDNGSCQWVGCDACEHWCHADCALRMFHIAHADGNSSGIMYRCVSCKRQCDLFMFVADVFRNCAHSWDAEALQKELDSVRRIFHGSKDIMGKQLYHLAGKMLGCLEIGIDLLEVRKVMLTFFNDKNRVDDSVKKQLPSVLKDDETFNAINAQDATFRLDVNLGTKFADAEKAVISALKDGRGIIEKKTEYEKECRNDEIKGINSMVQSKKEEAKLLEKRAEETHREAMNLQHALSSERERIEHEFSSTYAKLRLNEAEKKRMKMLEDLQILEKAKHDYQKMKMMMEVQIKNLLMTMDIIKWHYA